MRDGNLKQQNEIELDYIKDWDIHRERIFKEPHLAWDHCPEPFDDELFSSYFTRVTKANFAEPIPTLRVLEGRRIVLNRYDMDTRIKITTVGKIAEILKQDKNRLKEMCLFPSSKSVRHLFITKGARFCPYCLNEDVNPYYRFSWRLNFVSICPKHKCYLTDKCPTCNSDTRFWATKFNQLITECHNCGTDLKESSAKKIEHNIAQINSFIIFQNSLINAYKYQIWDENPINRKKFFIKIWKLVWSDYVLEKIKLRQDYYDTYDEYMNEIQNSIEKIFHVIWLTSKILEHNLERFEKPFVCPVDGKPFVDLIPFLRHNLSHEDLSCPLRECSSKASITLYRNYLKCFKCGTEFKRDGTILKRGIKLVCPLEECESVSIMVRDKDVICMICGTIFDTSGKIIKKGNKLKCPSEECKSTNVRSYKSQYRCYTCGTIINHQGKIIEKEKRMTCPLESCQSREIRIRKNGYKCEKCGTFFDKTGKITKKGKGFKQCPLKGCESRTIRIHDDYFSCYHCGTVFDFDMNILREGKRLQCPLDECQSSWVRTNQSQDNLVICRKCGTEFDIKGEIFKKGKRKICPSCRSKKVRADGDRYVCETCRTTFDIDGKIIKKGIIPKCPIETCKSGDIQFRFRDSYIICKKCGTKFSFEGEIIRRGMRKICPVCSSKWTVYNLMDHKNDSFLCKKCGTEFKFSNEILKKGKRKNCVKCGNNNTQYMIKKGNFRCNKCGHKFS
ncbi:MAG: TniQ family protein [Candidatus Helarchaeota archaeon]|nr:TniQ family protein [Candidatus Helarchaeota archaeon]